MAVRGTFDLNDRPASDAMARMRREGTETDAVFATLGETVDKVFTTKNVEQANRYQRALRDVDRSATLSLGNVRREWASTERQTIKSVATSEASIDKLQLRLDRLGLTKASPQIDLDGVTEAIAQVELLQRRLSSLSRRTASPRVGLPSATAVTAGRVATTGAARGGTSESFFGRSLKIPFAGSLPLPLVAGAVGAIPPLVGGAGALAGSLGAATLGAGAIGLGAAGVGAAGLGLGVPVGYSAIKGIKEASEGLKKYRLEVLKTGPDSKRSQQALHRYNLMLESAPGGTRQFLRAKTLLGEEFNSATAPARGSFTHMLTRGVNVGRQLTPLLGRASNEFFGEAQTQTGRFGDFLTGDRSRSFIQAMGAEATRSLAPVEHITENVAELFMNASRAARPFFHEGLMFLQHWTSGWKENSRDIRGVRSTMSGWVDNLKSWGKLIGATGRLGGDLLGAGTGSGRSMVVDLTKQLNTWDEWIQNNPRKVRAFFRESVDTVEKISSGVSKIAKMLWQIGQQLAPLLGNAAQLVTLLGNAGLLSPGGLPLLLAGGAGIRNATRGLGGRIRGTTGTTSGAPIILGGGGAAAGAAAGAGTLGERLAFGDTYRLARSYGYGRLGAAGAELGSGAVATRGMAFARGFAGRFLPFMALAGGLGAASYQGNLHDRIQAGVSSATLGLVEMPKTPAEKLDEASRHAGMVASYYAERYGGGTAGLQEQIAAIRRKRQRLLTPTAPGGVKGFIQRPFGAGSVLGVDLGQANTTEVSDSARKEAEALKRHQAELGMQFAEGQVGDIRQAMLIRTRHGANPLDAAKQASEGIEHRIKRLHGDTSKEFGQMSLDWVRQMVQAEPKLRKTYDNLSEMVENRLNKMGQNVAIIHGRIVDVSERSWNKVANQIDSATQRALSSANENLTALEKRAASILRGMGYNNTQAQSIVHEAQTGRPTKAGSESNWLAARHGMQGATLTGAEERMQRGHAGGGRLPMLSNGSMQDDIYLGNNQWGAAGELMVNRHTESRVDRILRLAGTSLGREVGREQRGHSKPIREDNAAFGRRFATGGIRAAARLATQMNMGVSGGPGFGGIPSSGHVSDSLHYQGLAYDVTGSAAQMHRYFLAALRDFRGSINELFYDPMGYYIDQGHRQPGAIGGHSDHVHIGFFPSGAHLVAGARLNGGSGGGGRGHIHLRGQRSGLGGIPGAAADQGNALVAAGMTHRINRLIGQRGGAGGAAGGLNGWLTRALRLTHHYSPENLRLLRGRAMQESGGNPRAVNNWDSNAAAGRPSKGLLQTIPETFSAYALPGHHNIFNPVDNAAAAIRYMFADYGHIVGPGSGGYTRGGRSRAGFAGWFRDGFRGRVSGPTLMGVGEAGAEDVQITPTPRRRRGGAAHGRRGHTLHVEVKMGGVTMHGSHDVQRTGKHIGERVAVEITKALEDSDGVGDEELTS